MPVLGLATIVVLLAAILSKRMSPLVALIIVPIAASLIDGFGLQTSKFVIDGLKSLAIQRILHGLFGLAPAPVIQVTVSSRRWSLRRMVLSTISCSSVLRSGLLRWRSRRGGRIPRAGIRMGSRLVLR
jgi:hypothetical protein